MKFAFFLFSAILFGHAAIAQPMLGTCPIFPSNNPWNTRVDTMPVDTAHSAAYIASVGGSINVHPDFGSDTDYGIPWEAVNGSQALVSINTSNGYQDQSDPGPMPIPLDPVIEHDDDSHVLIVDTSNHHLYELYQAVRDKNDDGWAATSSAIFALDSNNYRPDGWTSCDAAGLPIFPGLVRMYECQAGAINHALRFTVPSTQQAWIFPARHHAGQPTDTNHMPMGTRLRLKASFDESSYTGYAKVIIDALKKYGIILADNGSAWYISGEWNPNWPDDDIGQLKNLVGNDFEVVNTGYPIETDSKMYPTPVIPLPSGTNNGSGILHVASNPINFGSEKIGDADTMTISLSNIGTAPLIVSSLVPGGSKDFSILAIQPLQLPPDTLQPDAIVNATVRFAPSKLGGDTATLQLAISNSEATMQDTTILFIGNGIQNASVASDPSQAFDFTVFPNPTAGVSTVSFSGTVSSVHLELLDPVGRSVVDEIVPTSSTKLDLNNLAAGCYFLHVQCASGAANKLLEIIH